MKRKIIISPAVLLGGALCACLLSSCSREPLSGTTPQEEEGWSVVVTKGSPDTKSAQTTLAVNQDYDYSATVYRNGQPYDYTGAWVWDIDDESVMTLSYSGNQASVHTCELGETELSARPYALNSSLIGSITLTVEAAASIEFTDYPPTYDWEFGVIDLTAASPATTPVSAAFYCKGILRKSFTCGSSNAICDYSEDARMFYIASEKKIYYYTDNGGRGSDWEFSIVLSQDGHSDATIIPDSRPVYFALDDSNVGTCTEPVINIDETGTDVTFPIVYYDKQTGSFIYNATFSAPAIVRNAFPAYFDSEYRKSSVDYTDDDGLSYFGYDLDTDYDDNCAGYITVYGLHPGTGEVWLSSSDGMYPCEDMCVTVNVGSVASTTNTLVNRGYYHSTFATNPSAKTLSGVLPYGLNDLRYFEDNTVIPDSSHTGDYWWDLATDDSYFLENISYSSSSTKLTFFDPATSGGWYPTGSYIGKRTSTVTNSHTGNKYTFNNFVAFQIIQDIPYGLGCRFENESGTDGSSSFSWMSTYLGINIMPYITAESRRSYAEWDSCFPSVYAHSYFSVNGTIGSSTWVVTEHTDILSNNQYMEGDCPVWFRVTAGVDTGWFQISGTYPNGKYRPWTVTSGSDTKTRVFDKLEANAYSSDFRNIKIAPGSSPSSWTRSLTIDATHYANCGNGGYYYFYCIYDTNGDSVQTIENYFGDWSNY